jgi:hypothetical protein
MTVRLKMVGVEDEMSGCCNALVLATMWHAEDNKWWRLSLSKTDRFPPIGFQILVS